jgi:hypothetical protein
MNADRRAAKKAINDRWRSKPGIPERLCAYMRKHREEYPHLAILARAKRNAKVRGIPFSLVASDIPSIPECCPVFPWIRLVYAVGHSKKGGRPPYNAPSLDRIDNLQGYVKGNVRIISFRANELKRDATDREIAALGEDVRRRTLV